MVGPDPCLRPQARVCPCVVAAVQSVHQRLCCWHSVLLKVWGMLLRLCCIPSDASEPHKDRWGSAEVGGGAIVARSACARAPPCLPPPFFPPCSLSTVCCSRAQYAPQPGPGAPGDCRYYDYRCEPSAFASTAYALLFAVYCSMVLMFYAFLLKTFRQLRNRPYRCSSLPLTSLGRWMRSVAAAAHALCLWPCSVGAPESTCLTWRSPVQPYSCNGHARKLDSERRLHLADRGKDLAGCIRLLACAGKLLAGPAPTAVCLAGTTRWPTSQRA